MAHARLCSVCLVAGAAEVHSARSARRRRASKHMEPTYRRGELPAPFRGIVGMRRLEPAEPVVQAGDERQTQQQPLDRVTARSAEMLELV